MAAIIADTSPLLYLSRAGLLDLLPRLFTEIVIPEAVRSELLAGRRLGFDVVDPASRTWIAVRPVVRSPALEPFSLDEGERAVITLALGTPEALVILDDAAARAAAKALDIMTTGTLGILLLGKERGLVPAVSPLVDALRALGFRVTPLVRARVLALAGETG